MRSSINDTNDCTRALKSSQALSSKPNVTTLRKLPKDASVMTVEDWAEEWIRFNRKKQKA